MSPEPAREDTGGGRFRKLPVEVEAMRWDGSEQGINEIAAWIKGHISLDDNDGEPLLSWVTPGDDYKAVKDVQLVTLHGYVGVSEGDWVVRTVKGDFYPCNALVFDATHERAASASSSKDEEGGLDDDERELLNTLKSQDAERVEIEGDYIDAMQRLGYELVVHNERDGPCFGCSLSKMFDQLAAPSVSQQGTAAFRAALDEFFPEDEVDLIERLVDEHLGSQRGTGGVLRTRACPTHGNLHVAPPGIEPITHCPVLCIDEEECSEPLGPIRDWVPAPSQQKGGGHG
ncbi:MAG TPA: hypothetical protein VFF79_12965 [Conexibacter sp.]|jgi:hypothetical protein|nr:hypothetical protein [Conexibacter sp.]